MAGQRAKISETADGTVRRVSAHGAAERDRIFRALADTTRRSLLDALRERDGRTLGELEAFIAESGSGLTRFAIMKHLKVLEDAGLVVTHRAGRFKHHYLNIVPLQRALDEWIEPMLARPMAKAMLDLQARIEGRDE